MLFQNTVAASRQSAAKTILPFCMAGMANTMPANKRGDKESVRVQDHPDAAACQQSAAFGSHAS
jgi:hypothetical protein